MQLNFNASKGFATGKQSKIKFEASIMCISGVFVDRVLHCVHFKEGLKDSPPPNRQLEVFRSIVRNQSISIVEHSSETYRREIFDSVFISCSRLEAWTRVLCADHNCIAQTPSQAQHYVRHTLDYIDSCLYGQDWCLDHRHGNSYCAPAVGWGSEDLGGDSSEMVGLVTPSNSLFITENGYLGVAKDDGLFAKDGEGGLRAGDSIFILSGGNMPFVLREEKSLQKSESHGDKLWKIFNPCCVHGFMDGIHNYDLRQEQGGCTTLKII